MTAVQPIAQQTAVEVRNPADGTLVGEVPNDSADFRIALGVVRAAAGHGLRQTGIAPRGGRK